MKKGYIKVIIAVLIVIESITIFLVYKSLSNPVHKKEYNYVNDNMFAILIEQEDGTYKESTSWPSDEFLFDSYLSGCVDYSGNKLSGALSFNNETKEATVNTKTSTKCYLYFNVIQKAYALYFESDESLHFIKSMAYINSGSTYNNKNITYAFTGFDKKTYTKAEDVPWNENSNYMKNAGYKISSISFDNRITPTDTAFWFSNLNLESLDLTNLDTSNVSSMLGMFFESTFNNIIGIGDINTSNVNNMVSMFADVKIDGMNLDLKKWDVSNVKSMRGMFVESKINKGLNLSNWNISKVSDMGHMFHKVNLTNVKFDNWELASDVLLESMFLGATIDDTVNFSWDVSKVKNMSYMFEYAQINSSSIFSSWKTSNVTNMSYMFRETEFNSGLNIGNWDTSKVTDMSRMFAHAKINKEKINLIDWNVSNVTEYDNFNINVTGELVLPLFGDAYAVYTNSYGHNILVFLRSVTEIKIGDKIEEISGAGREYIVTEVFTDIETTNYNETTLPPWWKLVQDTSNLPIEEQPKPGEDINARSEVKTVLFYDTIRPISTYLWFFGIGGNADQVSLDVETLDVSKITNMYSMFAGAGANAKIVKIIGLNKWDTSNVTNMAGMFAQVGKNATTLLIEGISGWNTTNVTDMSYMFRSAGKSASSWNIGNPSAWNTSKVTNMSGMFYNAGANATYTLDLSKWNVSKVTSYIDFNYGVENKITLPNFK